MVNDNQTQARVEQPDKTDMTPPETDNLHSAGFLSPPTNAPQGSDAKATNSVESQLPTLILLQGKSDPTAAQQQVDKVSTDLVNYIDKTKNSLDLALYHFDLNGSDGQKVVAELNKKAEEGAKVRLAVYEPSVKGKTSVNAEGLQMNVDNSAFDKNIEIEGIKGSKLMHDKYMVRDAGSKDANVWTGSMNFTDEAFGSQENNVINLPSKGVADAYEQDFNEMWAKKSFAGTGKEALAPVQVGNSEVTVGFSPGDGSQITKEIAEQIKNAKQSVHIASMDISSLPVLDALAHDIKQTGANKVTVDGIYDGPEMRNVVNTWTKDAKAGSQSSADKLALWDEVSPHFVEKHSNTFGHGIANIMHDKIVDVDNSTVITGSFNFSNSAEQT